MIPKKTCIAVVAQLLLAAQTCQAFHDCIQPKQRRLSGAALPPGWLDQSSSSPPPPPGCSGGLCVGMHEGPHEGGPASYPVGDSARGYTTVSSTMTVPKMPQKIDGICYYIWTDIFFGDMSQGRMNQFVPQLVLGNALDGSSGPPAYKPHWGEHKTWSFVRGTHYLGTQAHTNSLSMQGAHYFFEFLNATGGSLESHAAYGTMYEAKEGELIETSFVATPPSAAERARGVAGPVWTLTMGIVGDPQRQSVLRVDQPYMGLGAHWDVPTTSWAELNYTNLCVNSCWELYGAKDAAHLPSGGSTYDIKIEQGSAGSFPWVTQWDEDEGLNRSCATSTITESHNATVQHVLWDISI